MSKIATPLTMIAPRSALNRWLFTAVAVLLAVGYFAMQHAYWAPASPMIDQNAYEMGGKQYAKSFTTGVTPANDFVYISAMYVRSPDGMYYPKYPLGLPMLYAAAHWVVQVTGINADGTECAFLVAPLSAAAATLGLYFLLSRFVSGFASILGALLLSFSPIALVLANQHWSHHPAMAVNIWGMFFLMTWWQKGGWWRGLSAGLLLGFAVLIRYTEGLLVLPLAYVVLSRFPYRSPREWSAIRKLLWPVVGWLVPVAYLVIFNKVAMGSWTGYDTTNESTGFSLAQLATNWEYVLKQLNGTATLFYLPVAALGLGISFQKDWRLGVFLMLWLVPGLVIYGAYYWGTDSALLPAVFYLRFFLSSLPPLACGAAILFDTLQQSTPATSDQSAARPRSRVLIGTLITLLIGAGVCVLVVTTTDMRVEVGVLIGVLAALVVAMVVGRGRGVAAPVVTGGLVALSAGISLNNSIGPLERDFAINANLWNVGRTVVQRVPKADMDKSPLLFTEPMALVNHLQVAGNFESYTRYAFTARMKPRQTSPRKDRDTPDPMQGARNIHTASVYQGKTEADLVKIQNDLMEKALSDGRRVYVVFSRASFKLFTDTFVTPAKFKVTKTYTWNDTVAMTDEGRKALLNLGPVGLWLGSGTPQQWTMAEVVLH